jgi:nucleotide-binding universal stress UspA family protein
VTTSTVSASAPAPAYTRPHVPAPVFAAVTGADGADVLRMAGLLAAKSGATLSVLAVVEPLPMYLPGTETVTYLPLDDEKERCAAMLDAVRQQVRDVLGASAVVSITVRVGDPAHTIANTARDLGAAVIVVGLGRHRPIDRLLGSETALRIVRLADRPVLAVAGAADALPTRVVVATDFSPSSTRAAEMALPFLGPKPSVSLVHVWHRIPLASPSVVLAEDAYERSLPAALARLGRVVEMPADAGVHTVSLEGQTAEQLLTFAKSSDADLIVVGRRSHSWIDRLFIGSVTTALLRGATCAVLVTPEPSLVEQDRLRRLVQGMSEGVHPGEWVAQLDGFSRRNQGRHVALEEDDPALGAQIVASGLPFLGATYDPHDRRIEVMLGEPGPAGRRLAHGVGDVASVGILVGDDRADTALGIRHGKGQTLLTFLPG